MYVLYLIQGCLGGMSLFVPRGGKGASPRLLVDNRDLARACSAVTLDTAIDIIAVIGGSGRCS